MVEQSHPTRGAWIEIGKGGLVRHRYRRRTPHGVRGLKSGLGGKSFGINIVAPHTGCVD